MRLTENFRRFNASQRHALDTCRNLAVRANAGSGKTSVIVERVVQLLAKSWDDGAPLKLSAIVAITFTRKAAGELQERLADSFRQLSLVTSDLREQAYWAALIEELPRAMVGTIDSFCARILREFGLLDRGLDRVEPDFEPLEGYEEDVLKREAINRVINRLSSASARAANAEEIAQVEACRWWAVEEGYDTLVAHLETLLNHFLDPETIIKAHQGLEPAVARVDGEWATWPVVRRLTQERGPLLTLLQGLVQAIADCNKAGSSLTELREGLCKVMEALRAGNRVGDEQALHLLAQALLTENETPRKRGLEPVAGHLKPLQDVWCPLLQALDFDYEGEVRAREAADRLVRVLEPVHAEYLRLCHAANRFDFLTLARRTRDLLKTHPMVREELKGRYRYVMLDEFQDTNELQWEIISWLVGAGPEGPLDKDRLFLVGDPQQSIYRFRHADVSVFRRVQNHIRTANQDHGHADRPTQYDLLSGSTASTDEQRLGLMPLAENYRSLTPMPLELMDRVFRHVFDAQAHGLDLEQNAFEIQYQPLEAGLSIGNPEAAGEIRYLIPTEEEENESDEETAGEQGEMSEAGESVGRLQVRAVVDQLVSLRGRPKYTAREDEPKTLDWRDLAVLLPSRSTVLTELEKEFRKRDVRFVVTKGIGFWQRQEVRDVINLATCLAESGDELALFAVLRSPVGQLSDTEILFLSQLGMGSLLRGLHHVVLVGAGLAVAVTADDKNRAYVVDRWRNFPPPVQAALRETWQEFPEESKNRLRRTAARLGNWPPGSWRRRVDRMAPADLLQRCLEESGAYAIYAAEAEGELILANLDRLFGLIRAEDVQSAPGLARLARWLREQMGNSLKEEQASLPPGSNAVQVMTVHAAKGLEFPVVAVLKMERKIDRGSNSRLLVKNVGERLLQPDAAVIPEPIPGTVAVKVRHPRRPREPYSPRLLAALHRLDLAQQRAESRRLFYVAATRAKERLILAGRQWSHPGRLPESWQKWFEDALGITEEHNQQKVRQDGARGHVVQIITEVSAGTRVEEAKPFVPHAPLALHFIHERPQTPTIATTSLEAMREQWKKPWEWWLKYRVQLNPQVKSPSTFLSGDGSEANGRQLGTVIGTLVHRLFEMPGAFELQAPEAFRKLLEAMAASLLLSPSGAGGSGEEENSALADPEMVRVTADVVEHTWQRLHTGKAEGKPVRKLLEAAGETEVPFVLKLGRWHVSGRYDKLLTTADGFEIVDWKTDKDDEPEKIVARHEPQMKLYALALHRAGLAALVKGNVRVHLAMLHPMRVKPLTFSLAELAAFADGLAHELEQMDAYEPGVSDYR